MLVCSYRKNNFKNIAVVIRRKMASIGSSIIRRCDLVGVGVALLVEVTRGGLLNFKY